MEHCSSGSFSLGQTQKDIHHPYAKFLLYLYMTVYEPIYV